MTVTERWTVYVDPSYDGKPVRQPSPREADRFGFEAVEVVPADQLQGAVSRVAELEAEVESLRDRAQHLRRALDACQARTGGQS